MNGLAVTINRRRAASERGFTLVEVLVVMILTGLISTVLFQGLAQSIRIRRSAGIETAQLQRNAMRLVWYRLLINGLVPDTSTGPARFKGGPSSFSGLSTNAIGLGAGAISSIKVSLDVDRGTRTTVLSVTSDSLRGTPEVIALLNLPGTDYEFEYVNHDSTRTPIWPRRTLEKLPQLPAAIWIVDAASSADSEMLTASVLGPRDPPPDRPNLLINQ